ncbi:MAG: hypothetical protein ACNA7E_10550, partial [Wenzhouxiangellaceae bacterium]
CRSSCPQVDQRQENIMSGATRSTRWTGILAALLLAGCGGINSSITLSEGDRVSGSLSTVNGKIVIGERAEVGGSLKTVNGAIELASNCRVGSAETVNGSISVADNVTSGGLETVNGSIRVGRDNRIGGAIESVNGSVDIGSGTRVDGTVSAVNGTLRLAGAHVAGLRNVKGGMELLPGTHVAGELRVIRPRGSLGSDPDVTIHENVVVEGPLVFERPVQLRIHRDAQVGEITGAEPEYFDGNS